MLKPPPEHADATATATATATGGMPALGALTTIAGLMVVATLYFGRDIFVPFALAVLLGFVLDPWVTRLRRQGLPRAAAVALVMLLTVGILGGTSLFLGSQVVQLSKNLPAYQSTIKAKLRTLRQTLSERNALASTTRLLEELGGEIEATRRAIDPAASRPATPMTRVLVEPAQRSAVQAAHDLIEPALAPLGTAGIVLVFVIYILLERNDLRDRLIRLAGANLHLSTDALGEAGDRVSRYLTMQLLVNLGYGLPMAAGLALIGVPGALLWGAVAGILRFVPYIGPVVAATFPLALAFAVDPGWQMVLWTLALVLTIELISNNLVEPWLYGASTGLSPVSLILSAVFWTALWGPIGLVLATPLSVCLAVLGRHIPSLLWLDILLGSHPVFDPPTRLYQRLLAGDVEEAIDMAGTQIDETSVKAFYSDCAVPALRLAANDHRHVSSVEHRLRVSTGITALLHDLRAEHPGSDAPASGPALLCIGTRWEVDGVAAEMVAHALRLEGAAARALAAGAVGVEQIGSLDLAGVQGVCLSYFSPTPEAHLRYVVRRLRRREPGLRLVAALWNAPPALLAPGAAAQLGVDAVAYTLAEACQLLLGVPAERDATSAPAPTDSSLPGPAQVAPMPLPMPTPAPLADPDLQAALAQAAQRLTDVFDMPLALVTLADPHCQVWHAARNLIDPDPMATPDAAHRDALVAWTLALRQTQVVEDTARDPVLAQHPAVQGTGLRFVAGTPLQRPDGTVIAALCVIDNAPRQFGDREARLLESIASELLAGALQPHTASARAGDAAAAADPPMPLPAHAAAA